MKRKITLSVVLSITSLLSLVFLLNNAAIAGLGWTIESAGFSGEYTSIALDSNGYPHISYLNYPAPYNVTYAYKDASGWHSLTIDASDNYLGAYTYLSDVG